jgi:hypothetical protein
VPLIIASVISKILPLIMNWLEYVLIFIIVYTGTG